MNMIHVRCYYSEGTNDRYYTFGTFKLSQKILSQVALETLKEMYDSAELMSDDNGSVIYGKNTPHGAVFSITAKLHDIHSPNKQASIDKLPIAIKGLKVQFLANLTKFKHRIGSDDLLDILDI